MTNFVFQLIIYNLYWEVLGIFVYIYLLLFEFVGFFFAINEYKEGAIF